MVRRRINSAQRKDILTTFEASATDDEATATATDTDDDDATNTATLTATESAAPTSTGAVVEVDLKNATIGDNAKLIEVDGKPAMYVFPIPFLDSIR